MKVLFLDIDGVLNKEGTKERFEEFVGIDETLLKLYMDWTLSEPRLSTLSVVLSSTWRREDPFKHHLISKGIAWIDQTPFVPSGTRGEEIAMWLGMNKGVEKFAILDDIQTQPLSKYLVQTSAKWGLRPRDLIRLDKLLGYD